MGKKGLHLLCCISGVFISVVVVLAIWYYIRIPAYGSTIICREPYYNLGKLTSANAKLIKHAFRLENKSGKPIRIVKHQTSCNCTFVATIDDPIPAHGAVDLPIRLNWEGRVGDIESKIILTTDQATNNLISLSVHGHIITNALLSNSELSFGSIQPYVVNTRYVDLLQGDDDISFRLLRIRNNKIANVYRVDPLTKVKLPLDGGPGKFAIELIASPVDSYIEENIAFVIGNTPDQERFLKITAKVVAPFQILPAAILLQGDQNTPKQSCRVRIMLADASKHITTKIDWPNGEPNPIPIEIVNSIEPHDTQVRFLDVKADITKIKSDLLHANLVTTAGNYQIRTPIIIRRLP